MEPTYMRLVQERYADRPPAPDDVLDWYAHDRWRGVICELLSDVIDRRVRRSFLRRQPHVVLRRPELVGQHHTVGPRA